MLKVLVSWPNFGPYHRARLRRAAERFGESGMRLIGLEIAGKEEQYAWKTGEDSGEFEHVRLFPEGTYERIPCGRLIQVLNQRLMQIQPDAAAINGYSSLDALTLMEWMRIHGRPVILMFESKEDDTRRIGLKEWIKRQLVCQCAAALCGGSPQREYLRRLGMREERIFLGYDAVDNAYFGERVEQARQEPERWRGLPGLESDKPYFLAAGRFIQRKNLDGLLRAYQLYRQRAKGSKEVAAWRLVILGDGEERRQLEALITREGIEGITLAGLRGYEELPGYYGLAGAFIHPARQDQWGLVVNEAMASGLPVLVSRQSGCARDLVHEGVNGFTFDASDIEGLAERMRQISTGEFDLREMGKASAVIIQEWGVERFARGLYEATICAMEGRKQSRSCT